MAGCSQHAEPAIGMQLNAELLHALLKLQLLPLAPNPRLSAVAAASLTSSEEAKASMTMIKGSWLKTVGLRCTISAARLNVVEIEPGPTASSTKSHGSWAVMSLSTFPHKPQLAGQLVTMKSESRLQMSPDDVAQRWQLG